MTVRFLPMSGCQWSIMVGQLEILTDELKSKISEAKLIEAEMAVTLSKMKFDKGILLVIESKKAVARSNEILEKLKYI
jgi:hypothetical protein